MNVDRVREALLKKGDRAYRDFMQKLVPGVDPETMIGISTPVLKKHARSGLDPAQRKAFMADLPHRYFEENNLHAYCIGGIRDVDQCIAAIDEFLPYVDNWATCDGLRPTVFKQYPEKLLAAIDRWMVSEHPYTRRFAIEMLMLHFLDARFERAYLEKVARVKSGEYYVNMMVAWYFAEALVRQYDESLPYLVNRRLDPWVHNKTIQKAVESHRISEDRKRWLKTLRISQVKDEVQGLE